MRKRLWIAAEHDGDVAKVAVHANTLRCGNHEVSGRSTFLFRSVFRVRADVDDFLGIAKLVHDFVAIVKQIVEVSEDGAEVFPGGDRAPPADRVEAHGNGTLRQQRRRITGFHFVRMVNAEHHERDAVRGSLPVFAGPCPGGIFVGAENVLRPEVARPQAIDSREKPRHLFLSNGGETGLLRMPMHCQGFAQRGANIASHRVVRSHRLIGTLEDNDVAFAGERPYDGLFGKGRITFR